MPQNESFIEELIQRARAAQALDPKELQPGCLLTIRNRTRTLNFRIINPKERWMVIDRSRRPLWEPDLQIEMEFSQPLEIGGTAHFKDRRFWDGATDDFVGARLSDITEIEVDGNRVLPAPAPPPDGQNADIVIKVVDGVTRVTVDGRQVFPPLPTAD
jgi:hypothetical protein